MKKTICIVLTAVMILLPAFMTSCEFLSKLDSIINAPDTDAPNTDAPNTDEPKTPETAAPAEITVKDVFTYTGPLNSSAASTHSRSITIPEVTSETEAAKAFNKNIFDYWFGQYQQMLTSKENEGLFFTISYKYTIKNGIVAIMMYCSQGIEASDYQETLYSFYYFDSKNDKTLADYKEYISVLGVTEQKLKGALESNATYANDSKIINEDGKKFMSDVSIAGCLIGDSSTDIVITCKLETVMYSATRSLAYTADGDLTK